jgi:ferredoxin
MEFWKDDARRECGTCGFEMHNPGKDLGCALWCKSARECLGLTPDEWEDLELERKEASLLIERKKEAMKTKAVRKIIMIDEEKCTGCGECIPSCAEGALQIVDGKARLITDKYCDGLGACLSECPFGALSIVEREAEEFDESAVLEHLGKAEEEAHGCPSAEARVLAPPEEREETPAMRGPSSLRTWPVQLGLVNPGNPVFKGADVLIVSDCVPVAYRYFHEDFLKGKVPIMGCPKLDDAESYLAKLKDLFKTGNVASVTVTRMEVPCCSGMTRLVQEAVRASGREIPLKEVVVGIDGNLAD